MCKEREVKKSNAIVFFDSDVKASELNAIFKESYDDIIINGILYIDDEFCIQCDKLVVKGITTDYCGANGPSIFIKGDLYANGSIFCHDIKVNGSMYCLEKIISLKIEVSENLCASEIDTHDCEIAIGGDLLCDNLLYTESITVMGNTQVKSNITAKRIEFMGLVEAKKIILKPKS